ncbi:MAG: kelch repeat-containing protein, partial [Fimbriimonadaceae bacterium]
MAKSFVCIATTVAGAVCLVASLIGRADLRQQPIRRPIRPPAVSWAPLVNQPPNSVVSGTYFNASEMFLMTDGSVLCVAADHSYDFGTDTYFSDPSVWKLTPDINGSYLNGTWSQVASMNHSRLYFASSVLADGRLLVCGGEYADGSSLLASNQKVWTNESEIYDPMSNTWTEVNPPAGWGNIGDAPCMVLPNGAFLLGSDFGVATALFDPTGNSWSAGPNIPTADGDSAEETWALLPNNRVLAVNCIDHPDSRFYDAVGNSWLDIGDTPADLVDPTDLELGPSMLMPDGTVFQMGAAPFDCIYSPSTNAWIDGPPTPTVNGVSLCAPDAPAAMEPNGKLLLALSTFDQGKLDDVTYFAETDGTTTTLVSTPTIASQFAPYVDRFLVLPTGQILLTAEGGSDPSNNTVYIGTPDGSPQSAWQPTITSVSGALQQASANNSLSGTQLNGMSQGSSYGDDSTNFTNYPIVRIQNAASGHVFYCRTHDHSTMGVQTGSAIVSTQFD